MGRYNNTYKRSSTRRGHFEMVICVWLTCSLCYELARE